MFYFGCFFVLFGFVCCLSGLCSPTGHLEAPALPVSPPRWWSSASASAAHPRCFCPVLVSHPLVAATAVSAASCNPGNSPRGASCSDLAPRVAPLRGFFPGSCSLRHPNPCSDPRRHPPPGPQPLPGSSQVQGSRGADQARSLPPRPACGDPGLCCRPPFPGPSRLLPRPDFSSLPLTSHLT